MPLPTSTRAKVATLAVAVGGVTAAATHVVETSMIGRVSKYFPTCSATDSTMQKRAIRYHAALAMGQDVYVVPIVPDSAGFPTLDMADRSKVDTTTYLSILCTMPHDSTVMPSSIVQPDTPLTSK